MACLQRFLVDIIENNTRRNALWLAYGCCSSHRNKFVIRVDICDWCGYSYGVRLHHLNDNKTQSLEEELMQDFMSIIASFSGKYSAMKSNQNKRALLEKAMKEVDENE